VTALLEAVDMTIAYGGVLANDAVDLRVGEGEFVGLIGANGAGKTSFVDGVTGFTPVTSGRVEFKGAAITTMAPHRRASAGLVRTFQAIELFDDLTVADNLLAAVETSSWRTFAGDLVRRRRSAAAAAQVEWALDLMGITDLARRLPSDLSNGQRKLVGVARALASRPDMVILDEPAAGLDAVESVDLSKTLRQLPAAGISVLLIDHDMGLVLSVCDRIYALDFGRIIAAGTPAEIRRSEAVVRAYLGESADTATGLDVHAVGGAL
jgi:branched-chain amino acid transport system ATP-binding protein